MLALLMLIIAATVPAVAAILPLIMAVVLTLFVLKRVSRKNKLRFLRFSAIVALVVGAKLTTLLGIQKYEYPMKWLLHYLLGSGEDLKVPDGVVTAAKSGIVSAMVKHRWYDEEAGLGFNSETQTGRFCLGNTWYYQGRGWEGKPALFYIVGGFTFSVDRSGHVYATDRYDWHKRGDGWCTTPFAWRGLVQKLVSVFGNGWFTLNGYPNGEIGITNKLWFDLAEVGAKEFVSVIDTNLFSPAEVRAFTSKKTRKVTAEQARPFLPICERPIASKKWWVGIYDNGKIVDVYESRRDGTLSHY